MAAAVLQPESAASRASSGRRPPPGRIPAGGRKRWVRAHLGHVPISLANLPELPGCSSVPTPGPRHCCAAAEQSSCSPGDVPGFMVLHGTCGTGHRPAEACTKAPPEARGVLATGPSREAKRSSSSQTLPGACSQQTSASPEAGGQAGISCSVLIASGAQEQETQQQIAREVRLCASWLGYRHGAAGDASQHALSASSTHAKCHD